MRKWLVTLALAVLAPAVPVFAADAATPRLESNAVLVVDQQEGIPLYGKNSNAIMPIASITKLMTAVVVLDANQPLEEELAVTYDDLDFVKGTRSRLGVGTLLTRGEMLKLALMASENRAASALGRHYPGGLPAFVAAMNRKARDLGMTNTHFVDSTGLNPENVSTAADLVKLVEAGYRHRVIREFTTSDSHYVSVEDGARNRILAFNNSNGLVRQGNWEIGLSKTGYISEAGRCLVMQALIGDKPVIIVLLDSWGKLSRMADANRIKQWLEVQMGVRETIQVASVRPTAHGVRVSRVIRSRHDSRRIRTRRM